jgi:hypothetical protein
MMLHAGVTRYTLSRESHPLSILCENHPNESGVESYDLVSSLIPARVVTCSKTDS